ncbi:hypothetical protein B0H14DRAFT_2567659 [Mycena olivaceomarginata]|nr:hypothetical protein B0H14DRAFT_2567659 [Mycena olivaceomarginata]
MLAVNPTGTLTVNLTGTLAVNPAGMLAVNPTGTLAVNQVNEGSGDPDGISSDIACLRDLLNPRKSVRKFIFGSYVARGIKCAFGHSYTYEKICSAESTLIFMKQKNDHKFKERTGSSIALLIWFGHPGDSPHDIRAKKLVLRRDKVAPPDSFLCARAIAEKRQVWRWDYVRTGVHDRPPILTEQEIVGEAPEQSQYLAPSPQGTTTHTFSSQFTSRLPITSSPLSSKGREPEETTSTQSAMSVFWTTRGPRPIPDSLDTDISGVRVMHEILHEHKKLPYPKSCIVYATMAFMDGEGKTCAQLSRTAKCHTCWDKGIEPEPGQLPNDIGMVNDQPLIWAGPFEHRFLKRKLEEAFGASANEARKRRGKGIQTQYGERHMYDALSSCGYCFTVGSEV